MEWISAGHSLPEKDVEVWVSDGKRVCVSKLIGWDGIVSWTGFYPTHWMHLPEPPKH